MSEGFDHQYHQQGIFSFPSEAANGFFAAANQHQAATLHPGVYESPASAAGTLSEMFSFAGTTPPELHPQIPDSAAAVMQLFLTDPNPRSPPPPPHHQQLPPTHMLLPSQGFTGVTGHQPHLTWVPAGGGQGLSLSLSSSLEAAKAKEVGGGMMFFSNQEAPSSSFKNLEEGQLYHNQNQHVMQLQQRYRHHLGHFGFGLSPASPGLGLVNALRNSKYTRPAQELLEEFCSVGRGYVNKNKLVRNNSPAASTSRGGEANEPPPLSAADRAEHQRRKIKLVTMLDEVERRYSHYCEQMQMVVNSYDVVMGYGASIPYTALAQKAMSRHFRCLKDAIQGQLRQSCEVLGDKEGFTGLTKGETPRLKALEQSLRQQSAFHQMGMMEHNAHAAAAAWRPQRGLPERSLHVLRAWLFEHFLHPYPSDADKHLLARQTGLSRNQVSNWFINARVRLWKPMVEEMYQQESKEEEEEEEVSNNNIDSSAHTPMHSSSITKTTQEAEAEADADATGNRSQHQINAPDPKSDTSSFPINPNPNPNPIIRRNHDAQGFLPAEASRGNAGPTMIRFGSSSAASASVSTRGGDVSLTLGLRHSASGGGGSQAEQSGYSFREYLEDV